MPVVTRLGKYCAHQQSVGCLMLLSEFVIDYTLRLAFCMCMLLDKIQHLTAQDLDVAELLFHVFHEGWLAAVHPDMLRKAAVSAPCQW